MLRRTRSKTPRPPRTSAREIGDLSEGQQQLVRVGLEALRNPEMERRVRAHLVERGDSPRDWIAAAFAATRFQREQSGLDRGAEAPKRSEGISPFA